MTTRRSVLGWLAGTATLTATFPAVSVEAAEARTQLVVVVAKNSPLGELSFADLRRLYRGEHVSDSNGKKLIPFNHPPFSKDRRGFDEVVLQMSADAAARYWIDRRIRGQSGPPKVVESVDLLQRVVSRLDGAVGYLRAGSVNDSVKVIRIEGKLPSDRGYRLEY